MEQKKEDEKWMRRCIQLAANGIEGAAPNPMVGAVIVHRGRIIGEGRHVRCGEAHAEVNAVASVRPSERALLRESTIYVSLEPCAHYGRTPPCAELIVREQIPRCVVGCGDTFAKVSGRGIDILRRAGVDVTVGVLDEECRRLNRRFFTVQELHRPFITLKWAQSADGFVDRRRTSGPAARISTPASRLRVHHLRSLHEALLVGRATLLSDRPRLDVRHWAGRSPLRLVLGHPSPAELPEGFEAFGDIPSLLASLTARNVQTLLVEGGPTTLQSFIDAGLWDEAWVETSTLSLGDGVSAPKMPAGARRYAETRFGAAITRYENPAPAPFS